jgi:hypothetical protein
MPQGQYRVRRRSERIAYERDRRKNYGYAETPATLARQFAEGLERTRLRLEQQREELRHLAAVRRQSR